MSAHVGVVTCSVANIDPDQPLLLAALQSAGLRASAPVWDDARVDWSQFDLVVLRSAWDYAPRRSEFLNWAQSVERLHNPYAVIERNSDKHYLADLARAGSPVIETQFVDVGDVAQFPSGPFVVKPTVGAGSLDAERYAPGDEQSALAHVSRLHAEQRDVMVQPYVESVDTEGETALIFIGGQFAHAMNKSAMLNVDQEDRNALFRREQMRSITVTPQTVRFAETALGHLDAGDLLYARVDLVRHGDGWAVMEVELTEPSLFLSSQPPVADLLARAIRARVASL